MGASMKHRSFSYLLRDSGDTRRDWCGFSPAAHKPRVLKCNARWRTLWSRGAPRATYHSAQSDPTPSSWYDGPHGSAGAFHRPQQSPARSPKASSSPNEPVSRASCLWARKFGRDAAADSSRDAPMSCRSTKSRHRSFVPAAYPRRHPVAVSGTAQANHPSA